MTYEPGATAAELRGYGSAPLRPELTRLREAVREAKLQPGVVRADLTPMPNEADTDSGQRRFATI